MMGEPMKSNLVYSNSGIALVRALAENGHDIFSNAEAKETALSMGVSLTYVYQILHHLERGGWIIRLKNGLYSLSSVVPGVSSLHEFQIAMALVQPAAIGLWSALNYHGMTEQVPRRVFVLTTSHTLPRSRSVKPTRPHRGYTVGNAIYQFVQVKPNHFFGITEVWINESKIKITDIERTCLDCLMFPEYIGGFYEALSIFERNTSKLDIEKLIQYALKLDAATIKRLGWILEQQGIPSDKLEPLQKAPIKGYRLLDKTAEAKGKYNARWMIHENLSTGSHDEIIKN